MKYISMVDKVYIKDIIGSDGAISPSKGNILYGFLYDRLKSGEPIELSFEGIAKCTSAFCYASFGKLYSNYDETIIDGLLHIVDIKKTSIWIYKINEAKLMATNETERNIRKKSISELCR